MTRSPCMVSLSDPRAVAQTARVLLSGGVVIIPTDTVYGLAAHPDHPQAVARISAIKSRNTTAKPIALLAADIAAVTACGALITPTAQRLSQRYWPGALTLVLPCGKIWEGFRVPDHVFTQTLLRACGGTLRVTSANLSGTLPAVSAGAALQDVGANADLIVDGGVACCQIPSSVVKISASGAIEILRTGAIPATALLQEHAGSPNARNL